VAGRLGGIGFDWTGLSSADRRQGATGTLSAPLGMRQPPQPEVESERFGLRREVAWLATS